jgi:hypothetical protein
VYRLDLDPIDVPYLVSNAGIEGVQQAMEAYAIYPQDNGFVAMTESIIGTYPASLLPRTATPARVYEPGPTDAGTMKVSNPSELVICNYVFQPGEGVFPVIETTGTLPVYAEGPWGISFDSTGVATDRVGCMNREFVPGSTFPELVRVEQGKQYQIRWHVTSTQATNRNSQFRMRARSVKFAWSQKFEIGGAWATGAPGAPPNPNNSIAQQSLPGVGCQNPDRYTTDTQGGWYTLLMYTPMDEQIRPEYPADTPLSDRMPILASEPGPGVDAASRRDLRVGCDLLDTLSQGGNRDLEQGQFIFDRIEVRAYDAVPD